MYKSITGENPYEVPMKIYPALALHNGWIDGYDYNLMTTNDGYVTIACEMKLLSLHQWGLTTI